MDDGGKKIDKKIRSYLTMYQEFAALEPDSPQVTYVILNGDHAVQPRQLKRQTDQVVNVALSRGLLCSVMIGPGHVSLTVVNGTAGQIASFAYTMHILLHEDAGAR